MQSASGPTIRGIDEARLEPWLAQNVAGSRPPFSYRLIVGGRSNLTYEVRDASGQRFVLRRPPLGHLLPTAHDVLREHRIIAALQDTAVPVPPALAACADASVNDAPFFVTRFVDGVVLDSVEKASALELPMREQLAYSLIDVLAELHLVDVDGVGLGDLSRREGYLDRQIARWNKQWAGSQTRPLPLVEQVAAELERRKPAQRESTIVHGDYRFGNMISDAGEGKIAAVLDWELCTLGDPLADLGHLAVYWHDPQLPLPLSNDPTAAGGFPSYAQLVERYAKRTGRDVTNINYYRAFAAWRLAVIAEGVASRHLEHHPEDSAALAMSQAAVARLVGFAAEMVGLAG
jgi:aminoglycoside phosphotransferase (APT) family kinase protein